MLCTCLNSKMRVVLLLTACVRPLKDSRTGGLSAHIAVRTFVPCMYANPGGYGENVCASVLTPEIGGGYS
jgi:hypothetical protein